MAIHLIGETIDKHRGHYAAETGKLIQLMRGIYVDAGDDIETTVLRHGVRIARYLYPQTYLSAASASLLAPTRQGRLYISGRRIQRTRIRSLEILQNQAPPNPALDTAIFDDGMGELRIDISSVRQRFLEAFRLRSEHGASIDETMRETLAQRLIEEYGGPKQAADALWALARQNEWYREGEGAERYLMRSASAFFPVRNEAELDLIVAWHGTPIGNLIHDSVEWRWRAAETRGPVVVRQTTPGKLPPFLASLLPEGWLEAVLKNPDERAALRSGKRYMSNITIVERASELAGLPSDILGRRLDLFCRDGLFTGTYAGPDRGALEQGFEQNLARIYSRTDVPRLSGVQIKAPMFLDAQGVLSPSVGRPFTHILKPAGTSGFEALPVAEWMALRLGETAGFSAPAIALVPMPDGLPPALVVERFDIRTAEDDPRLIAMEDLCSVLDLPPSAKYTGTMERVGRAIRPLSTGPKEDLLILLRRALFTWLIADGDMHLKNMALLKIAYPGDDSFKEVRLAPLYDAVTTRILPRLESDRMALKINGKDDRLRRRDFRDLGATIGVRAGDADAAIDDLTSRLRRGMEHVQLPELREFRDAAQAAINRILEILRERLATFDK